MKNRIWKVWYRDKNEISRNAVVVCERFETALRAVRGLGDITSVMEEQVDEVILISGEASTASAA